MMRMILAMALLLAGCGQPAPLTPDAGWRPTDGAAVQFRASRRGDGLVLEGVAQGVPTLEARHLRDGEVIRTVPVALRGARFTVTIAPVAGGDEVEIVGEGYRKSLRMEPFGRVGTGTQAEEEDTL